MRTTAVLLLGLLLLAVPIAAQQTGSIVGTARGPGGDPLPGVTVEAAGSTLPQPRSTVTDAAGNYRLALLPPGKYTVTFTLSGMESVQREVEVLLQQDLRVNAGLRPEGVTETVQVIAEAPLIDTSSAELKAAITNETIQELPVGQEYRDLIKLIPGVQYTEDTTRGPSAGGNGQDNVYLFDGVNVGLPLFGVLASEPSSHDIDQISIVKGGAKATDFNRSGGFTINSVSKSGTNMFHGTVSYQLQTEGMTGDRSTVSDARFQQDRDWTVANIGGPVVRDRLFFYGSYYRPTISRDNRSNLYGDVPNFDSTRDEFFLKLSASPIQSLLLNASYRDSDRTNTGVGVGGEATAGTASQGSDATFGVAIFEGSYVINDHSYLSGKYTDFSNENSDRPDTLFDFTISANGTVPLNINDLDHQGLLQVPQPLAGQDAYNAFIQPLIDRYGYVENGQRIGGGLVGGDNTINDQNFYRQGWELRYDYVLGEQVSHELHFGYQWSNEEEELLRLSNGWGYIEVPGGRITENGVPVFYKATFWQQSLRDGSVQLIPNINSRFEQQSLEVNDTIRLKNFTINVGFMASNDQLFGEGLKENKSNLSGFELALGHEYKMHEVDWQDTLAPRLGLVWSYNGIDSVYVNYAKYYPAASSLPRAASWARNLEAEIEAFFDVNGNLIDSEALAASSGKFFEAGINPRYIDEYLVGYSKQIDRHWTGKAHARYRRGGDFWEDTNNTARQAYNPPAGIPREPYIPELGDYRAEVGGSSYVIAQLDGAFTKYYEANLEADYRGDKTYFKGSYVWSHYYGNFDQDNTTTENDQAIFVGSSFIADGAGRQLWDNRYGNLRGDRRHALKLYGSYRLPWNASVGAYAIYQSGQPWEAWDVEVYRSLTSSTSDTSRYAEPAGSHTTDDHYQLDLNYTHTFRLADRYNISLRADLYNVFDKQTGYNIQNKVNSSGFGDPRSFFDPRRLQLAVRFEF